MQGSFFAEQPTAFEVAIGNPDKSLPRLLNSFDDPRNVPRRLRKAVWQRAKLVRENRLLLWSDRRFVTDDELEIERPEPEHKDELVATSDYMRGLIDGDEGRSPLDTPSGLRTSEYYRGHTAGTERRRARHEGNQHLYFETNGMRYGSDCRVMRGSFNKGA